MVLSWFMSRESKSERQRSDHALGLLGRVTASVPVVWYSEIENACLTAERRRLVRPAQTADFLARLSALPIVPDTASPVQRRDAILGLGREQGLSAYDAAYLELAMHTGAALATFDAALARAATRVGVELI